MQKQESKKNILIIFYNMFYIFLVVTVDMDKFSNKNACRFSTNMF